MIGYLVLPKVLLQLDCLQEVALELVETYDFAFLFSILALLLLGQELELIMGKHKEQVAALLSILIPATPFVNLSDRLAMSTNRVDLFVFPFLKTVNEYLEAQRPSRYRNITIRQLHHRVNLRAMFL